MKYKINYSKHGSEQVVDRLCDYIEKWQSRKQNAAFVPVKKIQSRRPSNINRISDDNIEINLLKGIIKYICITKKDVVFSKDINVSIDINPNSVL